MPTTTESTICSTIAARDADMRADLAAHVAIPTGHNHTAGLDEYRAILTSRLEALGAKTELIAGDPRPDWLLTPGWHGSPEPCESTSDAPAAQESRATGIPPTAVCRRPIDGGGGGRRFLFAGHIDTVFPPDSPFNAMHVAADGRTARGPGVVDMKGGLLITIVALEALAEAGVDLSWTVTLNSDEETGTFFSRRVLEREAARHDVGICPEPALPDGSLAIARKGSAQFMIETRGRAAHAGRDFDKGISAVYALAHTLTKVESLSDLPRAITLNVGPLQGGDATNAVPDSARAWGNARFPDVGAERDLAAALQSLNTPDDALPRTIVRYVANRPAKPTTPQVQSLADTARAVAESLGQALPFSTTGGVCDGNILQAAGLPTLDTLGVRGGGLHTHQEWIDLPSLVQRAQLLACLLLRLNETPD